MVMNRRRAPQKSHLDILHDFRIARESRLEF